jgi:ABC-type glycerol-3-phosphate transport system permease component
MKKGKGHELNIVSYLVLGIWSLIITGIFFWVIMSSFKTNLEIYTQPWALPIKATFDNFVSAWSTMKMKDYFVNSIVVVFSSIILCLVISTMTSHALTRYEFFGRKPLTNLLIATMSIPLQMLIIPLYDHLLALKLINTRIGLILVYAALWFPFSLFVLTGFFRTVPKELEEAALIDGCGEYRIFFHIMIPMVQPGIICISVFNFVAMWNEYLLALVFASKQNLRTIALGMYALKDSMMYTSNWGGLFAAIVIMMIPSIVIFLTLQKYIIQGLTLGAVKG